jgi:hypothetical protein
MRGWLDAGTFRCHCGFLLSFSPQKQRAGHPLFSFCSQFGALAGFDLPLLTGISDLTAGRLMLYF